MQISNILVALWFALIHCTHDKFFFHDKNYQTNWIFVFQVTDDNKIMKWAPTLQFSPPELATNGVLLIW